MNTSNSTALRIIETAKMLAEKKPSFRDNLNKLKSRLIEPYEMWAFNSIADLLGSPNNLVIELGARSISYNQADRKDALSIALDNENLSSRDHDIFINDPKTLTFKSLLDKYRLILCFVIIIIYTPVIYLVDTYNLPRYCVVIAPLILTVVISPVIRNSLKARKLNRECIIALKVSQMVEGLTRFSFDSIEET